MSQSGYMVKRIYEFVDPHPTRPTEKKFYQSNPTQQLLQIDPTQQVELNWVGGLMHMPIKHSRLSPNGNSK